MPHPDSILTPILAFAGITSAGLLFIRWATWQHKRDVAKYEAARKRELDHLLGPDKIDWNRSSQ